MLMLRDAPLTRPAGAYATLEVLGAVGDVDDRTEAGRISG